MLYWCLSGFYPQGVTLACVVEQCTLLVRVVNWCNDCVKGYAPWQLNLAILVMVGVHVVFYYYVFCVSLYIRVVSSAVVKLRRYISSYTFHKNPSLHLVCILMPPLVKEILETAASHNESPNFKRESNAKRVVSAAHQVVRDHVNPIYCSVYLSQSENMIRTSILIQCCLSV
jgi:hypothetical protein